MSKRTEQPVRDGPQEEAAVSALSFEEALAGLERSAETLKGEGTTLENLVKSFEEGMAFYDRCEAVLSEAKQRIEIRGKGTVL
jgi:exodeoxyribonuclease VII small subunit